MSQGTDSSKISQDEDPEIFLSSAKEKANKILESTGSSPFTLHGIKSGQKIEYVKKKCEKTAKNLQRAFASALEIDPEDIIEVEKSQLEIDMEELTNSIKDQLNVTTEYRKKIQLLTLIPKSYSARQAAKTFNVSRHLAKKAIALRDASGIFAKPDIIKRQRIDELVKSQVLDFYTDDDNSRQMPGQKDYVSVGGISIRSPCCCSH